MTEITVLLTQTEFYSTTFTVEELAAHYDCEATERAVTKALEDDDYAYAFDQDLRHDGSDNSEWSIG